MPRVAVPGMIAEDVMPVVNLPAACESMSTL
jgi:hypothetical protein